ncbi:hypothetical protein AB0L82_41025 [Nocardia sp. NPDC052001]|uniref:WXG100-like domain-containing protein n=1 Tax=Nocardia sp. NPDC052001 TaxID=3154853 RepID=UPI0034269747
MAIEIPHEVALFLNFAGVPYPDINEDQVRELAAHVGNFAAKVRESHEGATGVIQNMGAVWSGYSYQQLITMWARMSATHMAELDRACDIVSKALYVAAEVIAVTKAAVLAELAALASMYLASLAGTFATGGLSAIAAQALPAAANKLLSVMEQVLIAYILAEVLGKAIEPLAHLIDRMIGGTLHNMVADVLDLPAPPSSSSAPPMRIDPEEVLRYADALDAYADQMLSHAQDFADKVGGLDFTTAGGRDLESPNDTSRDPRTDAIATPRPDPTPPGNQSLSIAPPPVRPMQVQSPPVILPPAVTGGPQLPVHTDAVSAPTAPANVNATRPGSNPAVHESNSKGAGASTGSGPSSTAPAANPVSAPANVEAPRSSSVSPKTSSALWGDNGGLPRGSVGAQSVQPIGADAGTAISAPQSSNQVEMPGVTTPSVSGSEIPNSRASVEDYTSRTLGTGTDATTNSGDGGKSTVLGADSMAMGTPPGGRTASNPWRGGLARRRRPPRANRNQRSDAETAAAESEVRDRSAREPRQRGVSSTPWTKIGRAADTAAKVFAPEAPTPAPRVTAPSPVQRPPVPKGGSDADPDQKHDRPPERREDR